MTAIALPEPSDIERTTRRLCIRLAHLSVPAVRPRASAASIAHTSAVILEHLVLTMGAMEAAHELGITTSEALTRDVKRWIQLAKDLTKIDVTRLVRDMTRLGVRFESNSAAIAVARLDAIYNQLEDLASAVLRFCPVAQLEAEATRLGDLESAYRLRCAYGMLLSMRLRNQHPQDHRLVVVGQAYAQGRLSAEEVAQVLQVPIEDAVACLEECGFHRPIDKVQLSEEARSLLLAKIRESRLAAARTPAIHRRLVDRDVIASQRIEGIDARPWMHLTPA